MQKEDISNASPAKNLLKASTRLYIPFAQILFIFFLFILTDIWGQTSLLGQILPTNKTAEYLQNEIIKDWQLQDNINLDKTNQGQTNQDNLLLNNEISNEKNTKTEEYLAQCQKRRSERLQTLKETYPVIVFVKHFDLGGSHYAYTEAQSDAQAERNFQPGSALCLLELTEKDGVSEYVERTLISDPNGVIRDPDVSFDGQKIIFAWKKSDRLDDYHLYEWDMKTSAVRQLTFGLGYADYEPCVLANGDIIFTSTRCVQIVDCWWTEVSNLYRCDQNGKFMRRLSFDQVHSNYPKLMEDGRLIYTRWDYNDRGQIFPQALFQMNPDGTGQTEFYGNNSWFPTTLMHARPIPGTGKIVAVFSGHHTYQRGKLGIVDISQGRQENSGTQLIAPVRETKAERIDAFGQNGDRFTHPYPINENEFIVGYSLNGDWRTFGLYWMNQEGERELLVKDPSVSCSQPIPLTEREELRSRDVLVNNNSKWGTYTVQDVYLGPGLEGIERGKAKKLRVIGLGFRSVGIGKNINQGPGGSAMSSTPVSVGNGAWDVKYPLGDADIEKDGSVSFYAPAKMPLYFQILDENNHVLQTMRSWSTLQPNENFSCGGCHENKNIAVPSQLSSAMRKKPQTLQPFYGMNNVGQPNSNLTSELSQTDTPEADVLQTSILQSEVLQADIQPANISPTDVSKSLSKNVKSDSFMPKCRIGFRIGSKSTVSSTNVPQNDISPLNISSAGVPRNDILSSDILSSNNQQATIRSQGEWVGFSFPKMIQPILDKHCIECHCDSLLSPPYISGKEMSEKEKKAGTKAFSLLSKTFPDNLARRDWSESYLNLTAANRADGSQGHQNRAVSWLNVQSAPPMLVPPLDGAARSGLMKMFHPALAESGKTHNNILLSTEELDKLSFWMDTLVPYCGDYTEANRWNDEEWKKFEYYESKKIAMEQQDRENNQKHIDFVQGNLSLKEINNLEESSNLAAEIQETTYSNLLDLTSAVQKMEPKDGKNVWTVQFEKPVLVDQIRFSSKTELKKEKTFSVLIEGNRENIVLNPQKTTNSLMFNPKTIRSLSIQEISQETQEVQGTSFNEIKIEVLGIQKNLQ